MSVPETVNGLTTEQLRQRLGKIKCFMLDMDGTFYLGNQILDGSLDFLDAVERTGRRVLFLTNNSSKSADYYIQKLRRMNVREPFLNILTSGQATARYCKAHFPGKKAFLLGNHILAAEFEKMEVPVDNEHPDYVVIAFDTELDYAKMCAVCDAVRAGLPYIATHPDYNCPTETGFIPDIGAIIAFGGRAAGDGPQGGGAGHVRRPAVHRYCHRRQLWHDQHPGHERRNHLGGPGKERYQAPSDL